MREWTVLVYLAGDNNLEQAGIADLQEMKRVPLPPEITLVAQFDRMEDQGSRRYLISADQTLDDDCVQTIPESNTGDPGALVDFVTWAHAQWPARRYALVLWNHGSGVTDEDIYAAAREKSGDGVLPAAVRGLGDRHFRRALFASTVKDLVGLALASERGILFDDSSADFLDGRELQGALWQIANQLGQPLDLLGFDACLMSMVEIAWQVCTSCRVMVASQAVEDRQGWPYTRILEWLRGTPNASSAALGTAIVDCFAADVRARSRFAVATQSAVELARLAPVTSAVASLASALQNEPRRTATSALFQALRGVQTFDARRDYVDLRDLCARLAQSAHGSLAEAARAVVSALDGGPVPVIAERHEGPGLTRCCGLSIYLPSRSLSPPYARLDFAHATAWDKSLVACLGLEA